MAEKQLLPVHLEQHVKKVYEELKVKMKETLDKGLNSATVLTVTSEAMKIVGKMKDLVGYEKKVVVLSVVGKFVEETAKDLHEKFDELSDEVVQQLTELHVVVNNALSPYIDQLCALTPQLYGKTKEKCMSLKNIFKCRRS